MPSEAVLHTLGLTSARTQLGSSFSGPCTRVKQCTYVRTYVLYWMSPSVHHGTYILFTFRNLRKNIRVVVTVSASPPKLFQWMAKERPSLLRLMNVTHHRPWNQDNLLEVAELRIAGSQPWSLYSR